MARIAKVQDPVLQDVVQRDNYELVQGLRVANYLVPTSAPKRGQVLSYDDSIEQWVYNGGFDTPRPKLVYESADTISIEVAPGYSQVLLTQQDKKQRQWLDNGPVSLSENLDSGLSEASSTWYYIYLIPKSNNDRELSVIFSDSEAGPYLTDIYTYVGAVYNNSSSDIRNFYHVTASRFSVAESFAFLSRSGTTAKINVSTATFTPVTATAMTFAIYRVNTGTTGPNQQVFVDGETLFYAIHLDEGNDMEHTVSDMPVFSNQQIQYSCSGPFAQELRARSYIDGNLAWGNTHA